MPLRKGLKFHIKNRLIWFKIDIFYMRKNLLSRAHTQHSWRKRKKQFRIKNKKPQINVKIIHWILSTANQSPFPKIPAKSRNVSWLSLSCDNTGKVSAGTALARQCSSLSTEPARRPANTAQHLSMDGARPVPCARWPRRLLWDLGRAGAVWDTGCLAGVTACPKLRQGQAPLLLRPLHPRRACPKAIASKCSWRQQHFQHRRGKSREHQ